METAAVRLRNQMERKVLYPDPKLELYVTLGEVPKPMLPPPTKRGHTHSLGLLDLHPTEVARQLTLIEFALFKKIQPKECLNQALHTPYAWHTPLKWCYIPLMMRHPLVT